MEATAFIIEMKSYNDILFGLYRTDRPNPVNKGRGISQLPHRPLWSWKPGGTTQGGSPILLKNVKNKIAFE
jgi:hypothetical protein